MGSAGRKREGRHRCGGDSEDVCWQRDHVATDSELTVVHLIAEGATNRSVAQQLHLSPHTVKTHVQRLYEKLGVGDRGAAVAEAMRRGLLE